GRVTSVVRYAPNSRFPAHPHPDGEEILVLDGVFADEHGRYPAGTYLLNPEGFSHAPFSEEGCVLFVKLRQYPGLDRRQITVDSRSGGWQPGGPGREVLPLYAEEGRPEQMRLVRLAPGSEQPEHVHVGGEEVFVIEGDLADEAGRYRAGDWLRFPDGSRHRPSSQGGCLLYVKVGHLPPADPA
ncbi:MAG: cupin domain-containing protein, partial [Inquilinus sp.]|nr:cupin domain-containing protein [Inquilinus sp.]